MIEFQQVFGNRNKRQYGLLSNLLYNMRASYAFDKKLFFFQILPIIPAIIAAFLGTLIPSEVVRSLQNQWNISKMVCYICVLVFIMFLCNMISKGMMVYISRYSTNLYNYYSQKCFHKMMQLDYDLLEGEEEQKLIGNAWQAMRTRYNFTNACEAVPACITSMFSVVLYGILIGRQSLILILLMIFSVASSMWLLSFARKKHSEYHVNLSRYAKEAAYISRQAVESSAGKDIRIYRMADWFIKKYDEALDNMDSIFSSIHNWYFLRSLSDALIGFIIDSFAWGYLIYQLIEGNLNTAEFVFYLGLISGFSAYLETFIRLAMNLTPLSVQISYIREFLDLQNHWGNLQEHEHINSDIPFTIELRNVSYIYPGNEEPTISHINMKISSGEKIALLGLNGAGKTTLVKLICGFYQPTEGEILVNGKNISSYDREKYYNCISVLFQDTTLLPVSLDMNLTGHKPEEIDRNRLDWALNLAGFKSKYDSLTQKGDSFLIREVNDNSIDFSGGEKQKLLFARALYKKSGLLILDEPTAALDPIAENDLYQSFNDATEGRTSIYISHRLSSTRFCDRIFLLEHGHIIEEGTHASLMSKVTRYSQLFDIQSKYYKEEEEKARLSRIMGDIYKEDETRKEEIFHE